VTRTRTALLVAFLTATAGTTGCLLSSEQAGSSSNWSDAGPPELRHELGHPSQADRDHWPGTFDNKPVLQDFDEDGHDEIVAHSNDTTVYVFDPDTGRQLATLPTNYPPAWHIERILNAPAAGVLEPGQPASIVVANHASFVSVWRYDSAASSEDEFAFEKRWEIRMDQCYDSPSMDAGPVLADLTGDDSLEILVQTEEQGFYALESDGDVLWKHCWGGGNSEPRAGDLDGDGDLEAVFASDAGLISVIDGATGTPAWTFDAKQHVEPGSVTIAPTIADVDGELPREILFTARNATHDVEGEYDRNNMGIFAVHGDRTNGTGDLLWKREPSWANPMSYTELVVEDVDGDGEADVFGMDWNTIGHRPGDWQRLGPAHVFRLNETGHDVWVREIDAWWSNQNIALGDFDADDDYEVLANAPVEDGDGIWRLSAETGEAEGFLSTDPWKVLRVPQPVDVEDDGDMELMVTGRPLDTSLNRGAILLYDLEVPFVAAGPGDPPDPGSRNTTAAG
jgi:outer membrane protein assembly factor BamB